MQRKITILSVVCASLIAVAAAFAADNGPANVRIVPKNDATRVQVIASLPAKVLAEFPDGKLSAEQGERFITFTLVDKKSGKPGIPVLGKYERQRDQLILTPRFALVHGQHYRATLMLPGGENATSDYRVPDRPKMPPAIVERIYPSADVLPANLLKFYIHFSKPMRETAEVFDRITLLDGQGQPILDPWRRTELWDADTKRLTLFIHPGRIKQGVNLREQMGPVLRENETYTLRIDGQMLDGDGQALGKPFTKKFRTSADERTRPLPYKWTVSPPALKTKGPLKLEFPKPLDRALLDRLLTVTAATGKMVTGRIEVGAEEKSWAFHPAQDWTDADYVLEVDENLEDLAGNTPLRLFDVNLEEASPAPPRLSIRFHPK